MIEEPQILDLRRHKAKSKFHIKPNPVKDYDKVHGKTLVTVIFDYFGPILTILG